MPVDRISPIRLALRTGISVASNSPAASIDTNLVLICIASCPLSAEANILSAVSLTNSRQINSHKTWSNSLQNGCCALGVLIRRLGGISLMHRVRGTHGCGIANQRVAWGTPECPILVQFAVLVARIRQAFVACTFCVRFQKIDQSVGWLHCQRSKAKQARFVGHSP